MTLLFLYLFLAISISFVCSILEAVLLSVQPSYITSGEKKGADEAKLLRKFKDNLDRPLAAILTANTIAHTVGAAGVGAQSTVIFGSAYIGITSAILTLLILVLSEIIPKTLGATYWKELAPYAAILTHWLTRLFYPFVLMSERLTRLFSRAGASPFSFSRDEMEAMAEFGASEGLLDTRELKIIRNLLQLRRISVRNIMTPRPVLFSVSAHMTVGEYFEAHSQEPFSRILLYGEGSDNVFGYALKTDLFHAQASDLFDKPLVDYKRDPLVFPDQFAATDVFDKLIHEKCHLALIVNEYGTLCGLITLEDILETLIGLEIIDELDKVDDMQAFAYKRWQERMKKLGIDPDSLISKE